MQIKMLRSCYGSPDGHVATLYPKDAEFNVPHTLAVHFIGKGWALSMESLDFNEWFSDFLAEIRK